MRLIWYQRQDGLWNADCSCGATCCGVVLSERQDFEQWHFTRREEDRTRGHVHASCGPKFPEFDPNRPGPFVFP